MHLSDNQNAFLELVRAGLWEKDVQLAQYQEVDLNSIYKYAEEQAVPGLVAAGLEHVIDVKLPKEEVLMFVGSALQLEQRNKAMNCFIGNIVDKLREADIYTLLVKGQGVAQCYERPLWRSCGDVDLLLDSDNYDRAKVFFANIASSVEPEEFVSKHIGYSVDPWIVELHGHMYFGLLNRVDKVIYDVEKHILQGGGKRAWNNNGSVVYLPNPDNDIIVIFTHFLGHFCFGGVGLRQLCDMCRLIWNYKNDINNGLLKKRLNEMGLMSEWKVFASLSVNYLGMPANAMPFYDSSLCYKLKAKRACVRILKTGNFGHNLDESYRNINPRWKSSFITLWRRLNELSSLMFIFPLDAPMFFVKYLQSKRIIAKAKKSNLG